MFIAVLAFIAWMIEYHPQQAGDMAAILVIGVIAVFLIIFF